MHQKTITINFRNLRNIYGPQDLRNNFYQLGTYATFLVHQLPEHANFPVNFPGLSKQHLRSIFGQLPGNNEKISINFRHIHFLGLKKKFPSASGFRQHFRSSFGYLPNISINSSHFHNFLSTKVTKTFFINLRQLAK